MTATESAALQLAAINIFNEVGRGGDYGGREGKHQ